MLRSLLPCFVLFGLAAGPSFADMPIKSLPNIDATAYSLVDFDTGKVLAAKNSVQELPMASLTQLMTAYVVFEELAAGKLKLDEPVTISEHAWRQGGSRTFVQVGSRVPVRSLLLGMIVQSGNDATVALAERVAGTEKAFVRLMNATAKRLGLADTHYMDSTGLPVPGHFTTARDLSLLTIALIRDFPQYYHWFSVKQFEYNRIMQRNSNGLLVNDPGVDGLKTGHTDAAGYCVVASAKRNGMRLVSVVLGGETFSGRVTSSAALLNYGFTFYATRLLARADTPLATATVWKAQSPSVGVGIARDLYVTVPRSGIASLETSVTLQPRLMAPLSPNSTVGRLVVTDQGKEVATVPLYPLTADAAGGWWQNLVDTVKLSFP
ncbi:MAG TPA: D-alanyl-D-alanine carboxypeptidase family protein [Steroidobacteraceae bacterium]|nr:D-alanyl-D-alanine carboxypeptidase family protein [Steroidobacteraceae bacterium]